MGTGNKDIRFIVPAVPVSQPRGRAIRVNGRTIVVSAFRDSPAATFKATCKLAASAAHSGPPIEGPLGLTLIFVFPRLKGNTDSGRRPYIGRKDMDNLCKSVLDSLNKLIWKDDRQIVHLMCSKAEAAMDEQPHVEVVLWKDGL
jgi:Holliday junction resolvase RusA-like endonuclease